jgi:hypothetical protein
MHRRRDRIAHIEILAPAVKYPSGLDAGRIGKSGMPRLGDLRDFIARDFHSLQLLDAVEAHSGVIQGSGVNRKDAVAACRE